MGYRREAAARYSQIYRSSELVEAGDAFLLAIPEVPVVFLRLASTRGYMPFVIYRVGLGGLVLGPLQFEVLSGT